MAFNNSKNYYEILEVSVNSTSAEIKTAYRKLARKYHPDINKDKEAIEIFKSITIAYETLFDDKKRKQYNIINGIFETNNNTQTTYQEEPPKTQQTKYDEQQKYKQTTDTNKTNNRTTKPFSPIKAIKLWSAKFKKYQRTKENKKPQKGENITTDVTITPEEVITGSKRIINILTRQTCPKCYGHKFVNDGKCSNCNGTGEISKKKRITVTIPKGIKDGAKLRLKGEGASGKNGGPNGDLFINIKIETKTKVHFDKLNVYYNIPISPFEAALGEEIKIPTFDGTIKLKLPKNTCSGQKFRIANQGIKKNGKVGDLIITVSIEISQSLSDDEIKLYEKLKNISKDDLRKNLMNEN